MTAPTTGSARETGLSQRACGRQRAEPPGCFIKRTGFLFRHPLRHFDDVRAPRGAAGQLINRPRPAALRRARGPAERTGLTLLSKDPAMAVGRVDSSQT